MFQQSLVIPKSQLTTVTENTTLAEVYELFNKSEHAHTRAIPILDQTGDLFRGNIYKQHVFEHVAKNGDLDLPVTTMMRNSTKFIFTTSNFYEAFFAIRDLPFIAVLDEHHSFYGIFTHDTLMNLLAQSWSVHDGGVAMAVISHNTRGDLTKISKIITKYADIVSVQSLRNDAQQPLVILFTLALPYDSEQLEKIVKQLKRKTYDVHSIENLDRFK
ncbi:cyclic di-AMP binding protein CbpA [Leuconostoc fallax]|uniref:CBS domain-containing protein n=1 Tax=Leuconostoc fallax TaxID=1251 RepID=A0A4R5NA05_9LACO|nr:cyclic di-AMP binding protein CbpA [Leuconostoc fallax]MBU7456252.1 CBS domain-containing protein [Leuconostoc fallax]MCO6184434.1 cyclic di-AMP binding protein CbpA [Leuconostoc fallax]TDG69077.1 hypothetical protein C5L23_001208 [Leuconostoc fallax]